MSSGIYRLKELNKSLYVEELANFLSALREGPLSIVVFGSAARGQYVRGLSDVDVLVITAREPERRALTRGLTFCDVNVIFMSREEYCRTVRAGNQIALETWERGVVVYGAEPRELCHNN